MSNIDNSQDIIDVRDVIARAEELESEIADFFGLTIAELDRAEHGPELRAAGHDDIADEAEMLADLLDELKGAGGDEQWRGDWYPITLIRDSYFTEAMRELCEEIGDAPQDGFPSYMVIDWEATANNLRVDYTSVEYDGVTYWYR